MTDYDVVLLDLNLPDKDGIDILVFLRTADDSAKAAGSQRIEFADNGKPKKLINGQLAFAFSRLSDSLFFLPYDL